MDEYVIKPRIKNASLQLNTLQTNVKTAELKFTQRHLNKLYAHTLSIQCDYKQAIVAGYLEGKIDKEKYAHDLHVYFKYNFEPRAVSGKIGNCYGKRIKYFEMSAFGVISNGSRRRESAEMASGCLKYQLTAIT